MSNKVNIDTAFPLNCTINSYDYCPVLKYYFAFIFWQFQSVKQKWETKSVKLKVWNKKSETKSVKQKVWNKKGETKSVKQKCETKSMTPKV